MAGAAWRVNPACREGPSILARWGMAKSDPDRDARLAAALRDNLRRRKAQALVAPNEAPQRRDLTPNQKTDDAQLASE